MTIHYRCWDTSVNGYKTGDVSNHTLRWIKDGSAAAPTNSPLEIDATNAPGIYKLELTASETDCDIGDLVGKSSTANVVIIGPTIQFERLPDAAPGIDGGVPIVDASNLIAGIQGTITTFDALVAQAPTEDDVADSVLDELLAGHTIENSLGKTIADLAIGEIVNVPAVCHTFMIPAASEGTNTAREIRRKQLGEKLWVAMEFGRRIIDGNVIVSASAPSESEEGAVEAGTIEAAGTRLLFWLDENIGEDGDRIRIEFVVTDSQGQQHAGDCLVDVVST